VGRSGRRYRFVSPPGLTRRDRLRRRMAVGTAGLVLMAVGVVAGGWQLAKPVPSPVALATTRQRVVRGSAPDLAWPAVGEAAIDVPSMGLVVQGASEQPVPIASLTKIMTAYIVLRDHPLGPTSSGPTIVMTPTDVADVARDEADNDTSVPVVAGEHLTERQLLSGLMVHSANNFADTLARWDAGSIRAFVAKMNATAAALGMTKTHYVDTNGIEAGSVSTAADQLRLTARAMAIPAFAAVVDQPTVSEPLAGVLANYVQAIGTDGVVGVKSGFTQAAMGCVVLAADRQVDGQDVLVLAAVTGQPGFNPLGQAQTVALDLIGGVAASLRVAPIVPVGAVVARVEVPWEPGLGQVHATVVKPVSILVWPGTTVVSRFRPNRLGTDVHRGSVVGTLLVSDGIEQVADPVRSTRSITPPSAAWRLWH